MCTCLKLIYLFIYWLQVALVKAFIGNYLKIIVDKLTVMGLYVDKSSIHLYCKWYRYIVLDGAASYNLFHY